MSDMPDWVQGSQLVAPGDLGTLSVTTGNVQVIGTYTLSPFATGILVVLFVTSPVIGYVTVQGTVSAYRYVDLSNTNGQYWAPVYVPITGQADNPVTVSVALLSAYGGGTPLPVCHVYQLFGAAIQTVTNSPVQPLYVSEVAAPLNVAKLNNLLSAASSGSIAAGGSATVIAASAGDTITVYGWAIDVGALVAATVGLYAMTMEDTTAAVVVMRVGMYWDTDAGLGSMPKSMWIPPGITLPVGAGLKEVAAGANPGSIALPGTVYYTTTPAT